MRANHKSVNFQSVLEEGGCHGGAPGHHDSLEGSKYTSVPTVPPSSSGDRLHMMMSPASSLSRDDDETSSVGSSSTLGGGGGGISTSSSSAQLKLPKPRSRTPSPFRAIIKGLVKGIQ